ncbi:RAQPRD family integrative conjugative element protein [Vreelandella zhaodongensis]|uniref:integrative conjugative element protein, RAQPRD family n=1 Tax=Vreelandella zhaodongensis TaxID=1176240 RepID=UPI003EB715F7
MLYALHQILRFFYARRVLLPVTAALLTLPAASAGEPLWDEVMRRDLAVIQTQLGQVDLVIQRLEQRQALKTPASHRFYFDTNQLRRDLRAITEGIDDYLAPPRLPPRNLAPLSGDYLEGQY